MLKKPTAIGVSIVTIIAAIALVIVLEWRGNQAVTLEETEDVVLQGDINVQSMQETLTDQINSLPPSEARERIESDIGLALSRRCIQWTEVEEKDPSDENRENRERACREFRDYVDNGTLPASTPE
ncbi:MAG: hypothetical protein QNI99_04450 [Woeseiaceae bacterium]|nr:hypothetical protein [Woeseiaceae bacterium]